MILQYKLTKEDLYNFNFYVGWQAPERKKFRIKYYLKTILSALIGIFIGSFIIAEGEPSASFIFICIVLGLLIGFLAAHIGSHALYKRKIEKFIVDPNNANLLAKTELVISDNGILNRDEYSEVSYNWNAIIRKAETKDYIYLFLNSIQAIVIPKKLLGNDEEKQLLDILSRNLSLKAEFSKLYSF
jgi:hypothetical protein